MSKTRLESFVSLPIPRSPAGLVFYIALGYAAVWALNEVLNPEDVIMRDRNYGTQSPVESVSKNPGVGEHFCVVCGAPAAHLLGLAWYCSNHYDELVNDLS